MKRTSAQTAYERIDRTLKLHWAAVVMVAQAGIDRGVDGPDWPVVIKALDKLSEAMWALHHARTAMGDLVERDAKRRADGKLWK